MMQIVSLWTIGLSGFDVEMESNSYWPVKLRGQLVFGGARGVEMVKYSYFHSF